ncbi:DUF3575 domain-containing protein [Maribacter aquivivus]|uniref:DUF3575 domain-containing protein n=1 Tax=Maribacter aquivivus TaxID=228958 RepID=UPI002491E3BC|nr:DUF3575 domain-containing protein [Maribacter aquivivus]
MNKIIFSIAVLFISASSFAQAYHDNENSHEVKLNIGQFLVTTTIEFGYEYYINEDTSIGGTLYFDGKSTDYNGNFGIGPNLRAYFGYGPKSGLFAEVFGLYYTGDDDDEDTENLGGRNYDYSTVALGLGGGYKWATRSQKFTIELNGGLGRNINPEDFQNDFMFKAGLSLGYRF